MDKFSYAIGLGIGQNLLSMGAKGIAVDDFAQAIKDVLEGNQTAISHTEARDIVNKYFAELEEKMNAANIEAGKKFLEENKKREGVVTLPSGLQYEVITEGNVGHYAKATDQVQCHYEGTLIDGTLFDSSIKRGQPATFGVNQVIPGWVEALQLMGWLPSAPQLEENPIDLVKQAENKNVDPVEYVVDRLKSGDLRMSCEDPDNPKNWPRNMFVWRSNILGSSGKGHEYFMKHFLGTQHGVQGKDLGDEGPGKCSEVVWHDEAPEGKLDLVVTLDFRMSTTCVYSDIVLPTASWYEKNDLNTSDMHPFIHPLSKAIDPVWQSKSDWEIYKGFAKKFSELCEGHLGVEKEIVLNPIQHDTPGELAQPDVKEWRKGECDLIPGKTAPSMKVVERDYPATYERFTSLGPLLEKLGNGGKGIGWNTDHEVDFLKKLNGENKEGRAKIVTDIDACETVLSLAPETNGEVAVKAWSALSKVTGLDHTHLALPKEEEKIRFRDIQAQPRKIISSPTWSGLESEHVSYTANYTNVHEFIPWRTLTGRQQLYQDHPWMVDFGEALVSYRPPINTRTVQHMLDKHGEESPTILLNFITPHQKWGIHSTYTDNLHMLTLSRGGPIVWVSEVDANKIGIKDNDWLEVFNTNGAIVARAVVSQRVNEGMMLMYHAQEKLVHTPGSKITNARGGIHNSVTRATIKPTHMIGAYAQHLLVLGQQQLRQTLIQAAEGHFLHQLHQLGNPFGKQVEDEVPERGGLPHQAAEQGGGQHQQGEFGFGDAPGRVVGVSQQAAGGDDAGAAGLHPVQEQLPSGRGGLDDLDAAAQEQGKAPAGLLLGEHGGARRQPEQGLGLQQPFPLSGRQGGGQGRVELQQLAGLARVHGVASSAQTGAWSEGRSSFRGARSMPAARQRAARGADRSRWSMRRP